MKILIILPFAFLANCVTIHNNNFPAQQQAPQMHYYQEELLEPLEPVKYLKTAAAIDLLLGGYR